MGGRQSSDKDSSKTHEPISVAEETEHVQTRKDSEKKPSQSTSFSRVYLRHKEIEPSKPTSIRTADPDSFEKQESMKHASASSSPSSLPSTLTISAEASFYDDDPLHFGSRTRRYQRSYIHNLREEDFAFMRKQEYHASASAHTCSSSDRIRIKLSAKQLIEHDFLEPDYLIHIISKVCSESSTPKRYFASDPIFYLDLLVDLSEIECEKPSSKNIHRIPSSQDYCYMSMHHDEIFFLENDCQVSLVVTQTVQESVSKWVILQVDHAFKMMNLLYNKTSRRRKRVLESVDISGCTVLTQVLLLPEILSSYHQHTERLNRFLQICFSLKIICFFSKDLEHLKEDELAQLIEMSQPLVINGDIPNEHLQSLIQWICITQKGQIPLALAANNESLTHALIEVGADVNKTDKDGKTALFYAANNEKVTHALIEAGVDVNITDKDGKTALFYAANNEKVTHALIEAGVDVNKTDKDGKTAWFYAAHNENVSYALIESGAGVNKTNEYGKTALFYAAHNENVSHALIEAGADVSITDKNGKTALFFAGNNEKVTHALIKSGADVNVTDKYGKTALFFAGNNEKVTHALIKSGADVNKTNEYGKTALFYAVNNEKVTHALIKSGADVNKTNEYGKTALFYALKNEKVSHALIEAGVNVNQTDKDGKTAFLHVFDTDISNIHGFNPSKQICKCLLENGSSLCETSKEEETAFHLILKRCQYAIISAIGENEKQITLLELLSILELFSELRQSKVAVNKRDIHLNSPLHSWASLTMASSYDYGKNAVFDGYSFERLLKRILDLLLKCGVQLDDKNERGETPLHACRTWTAVKLLLDAGADPSVTDSSGRTPLLAAAMNDTCLKNYSDRFYPDVAQEPRMFWDDALDKNLDPCTTDKNGESVLSVILKKNCYQLASSLVEVACKRNYTQSGEAGVSLLAAICKDKSTERKLNKIFLVKKLLSSRRILAQGRLSNQDTPLHVSCRNMLELLEESVKTSLHWKIAQYLLLCGAGVETPGVDGKSCLELAEKCSVLKDLLSMPVSSEEVSPLIDTWKEKSLKHKETLEKVARGSHCEQIKSVFYFNKALDNGSFGLVFVGINTQYGKEVAAKRVEIMRVDQEKVRKEIKDLKATIDCDKVIQCLLCTEDKDFLYVVLELMEGNLVELLSDEHTFDNHHKIKLCRDVITGLEYLHRNNITHRGIKPGNILYQGPSTAINLKLAFFGLRCQMSERSTSDFTDTYESLTKTRCWMAPEVLQSQSHSQSSDVFSCGLVIHYLLSDKKHPFAPLGSSEETSLAVSIETVGNITHNEIELDEAISSDAKDLLKGMLDQDPSRRPKISQVMAHRYFQATSE